MPENQFYEGDEVNLKKHFIDCKKNPGHANFIPYKSFKMDDIPESHRDPDMFEFIKVVADLTVRINVNCVSPDRPEFWPRTKKPYPLFENREAKQIKSKGSGQVNDVIQFKDGIGFDRYGNEVKRKYKLCQCSKCKNSGNKINVWWEIIIRTAPHVVFDIFEAKDTSCRLFFDGQEDRSQATQEEPNTKKDCPDDILKSLNLQEDRTQATQEEPNTKKDCPDDILKSLNLEEVNVDEDWCLLTYLFCDDDMNFMKHRDTLLNKVQQRVDLWKKVCQKHKGKGDGFTFIVSHPHGVHKHITFGKYIEKNNEGDYDDKLGKFADNKMDRTTLTYDTPTCKGSSGAPVRCIDLGEGYVHSCTKNGQNCSGVSLVFKKGSPHI